MVGWWCVCMSVLHLADKTANFGTAKFQGLRSPSRSAGLSACFMGPIDEVTIVVATNLDSGKFVRHNTQMARR